MPTVQTPTIGRRLWYWPGESDRRPIDYYQPYDAGVVFVDADSQHVTLSVTDHYGHQFVREDVQVLNERADGAAQWMPYQQAQHAQRIQPAQVGQQAQQPQAQDQREQPGAVVDNSDAGIERAIVAAGAIKGPRITPEHIDSLIVDEVFFTAEQGYQAGMKAEHPDLAAAGNSFPYSTLAQITVCVLVLRNGHKVVGVNEGPVSPENFDAELGRQYARQKAVDQIWPLEGYLLREQLFQRTQPAEPPTGDLF